MISALTLSQQVHIQGKRSKQFRGEECGQLLTPAVFSCQISNRGCHQVAPEVRLLKRLKKDEVRSSHSNKQLSKTEKLSPGSICKHTLLHLQAFASVACSAWRILPHTPLTPVCSVSCSSSRLRTKISSSQTRVIEHLGAPGFPEGESSILMNEQKASCAVLG